MNKKEEKALDGYIRKRFGEVYSNGLRAGAKSMCHVIMEKAKNEKLSESERILEIIQFCQISLDNHNGGSKK